MKLNAKRTNQLKYGVVAWLCARGQRLVQALTTKSGVLGQLAHTSSLCNVSDCLKKDVGILTFQRSVQVLSNDNVVVDYVFSPLQKHGGEAFRER